MIFWAEKANQIGTCKAENHRNWSTSSGVSIEESIFQNLGPPAKWPKNADNYTICISNEPKMINVVIYIFDILFCLGGSKGPNLAKILNFLAEH